MKKTLEERLREVISPLLGQDEQEFRELLATGQVFTDTEAQARLKAILDKAEIMLVGTRVYPHKAWSPFQWTVYHKGKEVARV